MVKHLVNTKGLTVANNNKKLETFSKEKSFFAKKKTCFPFPCYGFQKKWKQACLATECPFTVQTDDTGMCLFFIIIILFVHCRLRGQHWNVTQTDRSISITFYHNVWLFHLCVCTLLGFLKTLQRLVFPSSTESDHEILLQLSSQMDPTPNFPCARTVTGSSPATFIPAKFPHVWGILVLDLWNIYTRCVTCEQFIVSKERWLAEDTAGKIQISLLRSAFEE